MQLRSFILLFFLSLAALRLHAQTTIDEALAYQYYQQGEYDKAAVLLEKLFDKNKDDQTFELYFTSLIRIKKYEDAATIIKKMIRLSPQKPLYKIALGRVYLESGKTDDAGKLFTDAIQHLPDNEFAIRETANYFFRFEAYDMAAATFLQGRKVLNDEKAFIYELISIYRFRKDKVRLIDEYLNVLSTNPQMLLQAQNAFGVVFENNTDYQLLQSALLKKIQKDPTVEVYNQLFIWQLLQQQEYEMALRQLIAQDKRTRDDGALLYNTAASFVTNKAYPTAVKAYEYLLSKGKESSYYLASLIQLVNTKFELAISGKYNAEEIGLLAAQFRSIVDEYGKTSQTLFALQRWAYLQAYYLNDLKKAEQALEECLAIPMIPPFEAARIKLELGDTYILTRQPWEAFLIYEQVARQYENQPIGQDAKFRSARLSFYQGDFAYAKAQADVLKASTSQLIANDALTLSLLISDNLQSKPDSLALLQFAQAEMILFSNKPELALIKLDSISILYPNSSLNDDILMSKARIYLKMNELYKASEALSMIINSSPNGIWGDDALFMLGELWEKRLGDPEKAKIYYQQLMEKHPDSLFYTEARKRFRSLRGDQLGI